MLKGATTHFYCLFDESVLISEWNVSNLIDCANISKRSVAANQPFLYWIEWNISLSLWVSIRSFITCFTSFTETGWNENLLVILKFCLIVLMLGWLTNLIKMLSISSLLVYDGGTLEELSVYMCRSSESTIDPKYSLNVLAISLFLKIISAFSCNIMSVSALLYLFEK